MKENLTIARALKEKNRIASTIAKNWKKISSFNSLLKGAERPYDINVLLKETLELTDELVTIKRNIHDKSSPVREKIFRLSEIKNIISKLEDIPTKDGLGLVKNRGYDVRDEMEATLKPTDIDRLISEYQKEIDSIQMELDIFNFNTKLG